MVYYIISSEGRTVVGGVGYLSNEPLNHLCRIRLIHPAAVTRHFRSEKAVLFSEIQHTLMVEGILIWVEDIDRQQERNLLLALL